MNRLREALHTITRMPTESQYLADGPGYAADQMQDVARRALDDDDKARRGIQQQADALTELPVGWDTYRGLPTRKENAERAAEIAARLADLFPCEPSLVPIGDGSCQVEWHCGGWDVEVVVARVDQ